MSDFHYVAVLTYGSEKQRDVSSFKIGRGAGIDALLTLFGSRAKETTPPQASYRYVHVDQKDMTTHHNYLVLRVTSDEKDQIETICRKVGSYTWVYLWEQDTRRWLEFPCAPQAHYLDPSSYGGSCPKFPPTAARFITPSTPINDEPEVSADTLVTITQSGDWWWIGGDTYAHKEVLRAAGARWSKKRQQWYYIGETLPKQIQVLISEVLPASPLPDVPDQSPALRSDREISATGDEPPHSAKPENTLTITAEPTPTPTYPVPIASDAVPEAVSEPGVQEVLDSGETLMRSVRTDDVTAALIAHIHDNERNKPVFIDFISSRNAIKQLLSKPFNPAYIGIKAENPAFTVVDGDRYVAFRLPDANYKALNTTLSGRVTEGRIVSLDATITAPRTECYVLVMNQIEPLSVGLTVDEAWLHYVRYRQTPNRPEFALYTPPVWAADLYKVYQALRVRIGRPLHERWMPWLFEQVADKLVSSDKLGLRGISLCKYIPGYIDSKARGTVECGAYRLTCRDLSDLWAEILIRNPQRADGITFASAE